MSAIATIKTLCASAGVDASDVFMLEATIEKFGVEGAETLYAGVLDYCAPAREELETTLLRLIPARATQNQRQHLEREIAKILLGVIGATCTQLAG